MCFNWARILPSLGHGQAISTENDYEKTFEVPRIFSAHAAGLDFTKKHPELYGIQGIQRFFGQFILSFTGAIWGKPTTLLGGDDLDSQHIDICCLVFEDITRISMLGFYQPNIEIE